MREYIILVAISAILAAVTDVLAPKEWSGYIRTITGFLILAVLLSPVAKFKNVELFVPDSNFEVSEIPVKNKVKEELQKNVEGDIKERMLDEFGVEGEAFVVIDTDEENKIKGVKSIGIRGENLPEELKKRLKEVYGCEDVEFRP